MDILNNLNIAFRIDTFEEASDEKTIQQLSNFSKINISQEYLEIIGKKQNLKSP